MQCIESDINIKNVQVATAAILIQIEIELWYPLQPFRNSAIHFITVSTRIFTRWKTRDEI